MDRTQQTDLARTLGGLVGLGWQFLSKYLDLSWKPEVKHFETVCHSGERHTTVEKTMSI